MNAQQVAIIASSLLLHLQAAEANLIADGSFESVFPGDLYRSYSAGSSLGAWTVESGTVEAVGRYWQAADGETSLDLNGVFDLRGTIRQTVATSRGQEYQLSFKLAGNPDSQDDTPKRVRVWWDGVILAELEFDIRGRSRTDMGWNAHEFRVTATQDLTALRFESLQAGFLGPALDDVRLTSVGPTGPRLSAGLHIGLTIEGELGSACRIEVQDAAGKEWKPLTNVVLATTPFVWFDPTPAGHPARLYRAVLLQ